MTLLSTNSGYYQLPHPIINNMTYFQPTQAIIIKSYVIMACNETTPGSFTQCPYTIFCPLATYNYFFFQQSIPIFGMLPLQLRMKPSKSTTKHRKVSTQYLPALGYKGRQPSIGTTLFHAGKYFACPLISGCNKQWVYVQLKF